MLFYCHLERDENYDGLKYDWTWIIGPLQLIKRITGEMRSSETTKSERILQVIITFFKKVIQRYQKVHPCHAMSATLESHLIRKAPAYKANLAKCLKFFIHITKSSFTCSSGNELFHIVNAHMMFEADFH